MLILHIRSLPLTAPQGLLVRTARSFSRAAGIAIALLVAATAASAQSFSISNLDFGGLGSVSSGTSLEFGPDGWLYVLQLDGTIDIFEIERQAMDDYVVIGAEELLGVKSIPNHDDDGTPDGTNKREATGLTVVGSATNPVIYATSSDSRIGGPSGDTDLDTNSGVITRLSWVGSDRDDPSGFWDIVDIVNGLPRSEENHATNGLEFATIGGNDYLIVSSGGHTNAGSPSTNFAWHTEYALSAAVLAVDLTVLEAMPILNDGTRQFVYDLPTLDDPTRANANGITDPDDPGYDGVDVRDPWGGNDGLNQAMLVVGGPVEIFSPGYRNTYDLVLTQNGAVYVTDNGANPGWGGFPENEGTSGATTNNYRPGEPGSTGSDPVGGDPQVNNKDHLTLVTTDIQSYAFGSFYGGHPTPVRANPGGAGLFTRGSHSSDPGDSNGNGYSDDWFRTVPFDPSAGGEAADAQQALPSDWPPVPLALANPVEGDFRNPGESNPDGTDDVIVTTWQTNTNGIDEYTASNFGGAMQGDLIAGRNGGGNLHRVQLNPGGGLDTLTQDFISGLGGNALGVTANGDSDPFPGSIWVATFDSSIRVLEPQDFIVCPLPGDPGYDPNDDNDSDGYTNQDEDDNATDMCNGGSRPQDFDRDAGSPLVSDLNDPDDDNDGTDDALDAFQLGDPADSGSDAFALPVSNELFSDNLVLGGYLGLGFTGLMNNGDPNPNWLDWVDETGDGPNPDDILGGAIGAMTMQMTEGTAYGTANTQEKGFQYGVQVDAGTAGFRVQARLLNFQSGLQLYPFAGPGELGVFLGDGTQSNFIMLVVDHAGIELLQEIGDVPQTPVNVAIDVGSRPASSLEFELVVDSGTGEVEAFYGIDGGPLVSLGSVFAQGTILDAIQLSTSPLSLGLIGSSHTPGAEVEGTWDYLKVIGARPAVTTPIFDITAVVGGSPQDVDLAAFFEDDGGDANLSFTIESESNPADIGASISGATLTLTFPAIVASSTITVRATDAGGLFVEDTFVVSTIDPQPIYRINSGGGQIAAIDGGIPWEEDTTSSNSPYLAIDGGNRAFASAKTGYDPGVDLSTTPTAIYAWERWAEDSGSPSMRYAFPIAQPGSYEVRLYMGNGWNGANDPGERVFSATIEGNVYPDLTDLDLTATFGHQIGGVVTHTVDVTDGTLEIDFTHGSADNPMLNGIEIMGGIGGSSGTPIVVDSVSYQFNLEGESIALPITASGGDTGSLSYSAMGLPPGLSIDGNNGLISGTIAVGSSAASPYAVSVTVDDLDGDATDTQSIFFGWAIDDPFAPVWIDLAEDESYTARHECSFVQAGDRFYLFGGRENAQTLDTYDYAVDSWSTSASAPLEFNHFQATEHEGLVWIVGAFETNNFPTEDPADDVWIYDPANDEWIQGPPIPSARRRGGAGLVVHDGKFYVVAGNTIGHDGGYVPWFDVYDPVAATWTALPDAPRARDHFHAVVANDKLYAIGGRLSGGPGGTFAPLIAEVDVYDFATESWSTLPFAQNLPTPRAASAMALFDDEILVIGGEGNGQAYDTVEALDPTTNTWRTAASLNHARHGTQAIVSGGSVFVAGGSPNQGGGNQKNMEVYPTHAATGTAPTSGSLYVDAIRVVPIGGTRQVSVQHDGGSQGVVVESLSITGPDADDFQIVDPGPFLVGIGGIRDVEVSYTGADESATATLTLHYGGGQTEVITLTSSAPSIPIGPAAQFLLFGVLCVWGMRAIRQRSLR